MINRRETSSNIFEVLPRFMQIVRGEIKLITGSQLSFREFRILANIRRGLNHVGEIALHHGVKQPVITRLVDELVAKGFVSRIHDGNDRRKINLSLTDAGLGKFKDIKASASKNFIKKMNNLSDDELLILDQSLLIFSTLIAQEQK